jgi:hypothetical protein
MHKQTLMELAERTQKMLRHLEIKSKGRGLEQLGDTLEILSKDLHGAMVDAFGGTYDWEADANDFKEFEDPPVPGKHHLTISGVDCELFMIKEGEVIPIPAAQGMSWLAKQKDYDTVEVEGSLICLLIGPSPFQPNMDFETAVLQAKLDGDRYMHVYFKGFRITGCGTGVSIDDITVDENYTFSASEVSPWKPGALVERIEGDQYALIREGGHAGIR